MNVVKCESGHFYDADTYAGCPHCVTRGVPAEEEKSGGLFSGFRKLRKKDTASTAVGSGTAFFPQTEILREEVKEPPMAVSKPEPKTAAKPEPVKSPKTAPSVIPTVGKETAAPLADVSAEKKAAEPDEVPHVEKKEPATKTSREILPTVGYFCPSAESVSPCVGWLVGLQGAYRGVSLELKAGGNSIGRSTSNTVAFPLDNRVSRELHAYLVYEPRKRMYYIESGRCSGLTYVNGEAILHHVALNAGDKIEIGGGVYLFVPLCSETFSWEAYS